MTGAVAEETVWSSSGDETSNSPVRILQQLIRFDTTNPPGHEEACIRYIEGLLQDAGIPSAILAKESGRPNLIARLPGSGEAPPLLLYGHVDVVDTTKQEWSRDPFGGELEDGYIWGRGTLDMKGGIAMMLAAFIRAHQEAVPLKGDIILAIVSDEEAGGDLGAGYLVEQFPHLFEGVNYAIGEFGGFTFQSGGRTFYPVMVAEKGLCWLKATIRGDGGHGSLGHRDGCMAQLGDMLQWLNRVKLPVHVTPAASLMIHAMADALPAASGFLLRQLLRPGWTGAVLKLLGDKGKLFQSLLYNTISATIVRGGEKINVHPSEIEVQLDGRLVPGFTPEQFIEELYQSGLSRKIKLELLLHDPIPAAPDMGLFPLLSEVLKAADRDAIPVPMLLPGGTDGRHFDKLGIQTYGYLPMPLPEQLNFTSLIHAADERVPAESILFGAEALYRVLARYGETDLRK
ncbi:M20/M25/M40 family metallo-hydrolase [Paenibacillus sp. GCM10027627]|uniref:M20/M25/M40 family metallo-hydrolase n=1 Tax=unclassified Paenibacillus TaxID=185978 RepID=UPI00363043B5